MKTKLFNQLKQAYANKYGVADEIIQGQAEALVATGLVADENIATFVQGQESVFRAIQSKFDKVRTESSTYKKELDELKTKQGVEILKDEKKPSEIQQILDNQAMITKELSDLKNEKMQGALSTSLVSLLKEKKIPESYFSVAIEGRQLKDEAEVVALASKLETGYTVHKQGLKDLGFAETIPHFKLWIKNRLARWYDYVEKHDNDGYFKSVLRTFERKNNEILNYCENMVSNSFVESFNAKMKAFRARWKGIKDTKFFLFRINTILG